jgi:hypothetical protein
MKKNLLLAVIISAFAANALAWDTPETPPMQPSSATSNSKANASAIGLGMGVGIGTGGSVRNSGNSSNRNSNRSKSVATGGKGGKGGAGGNASNTNNNGGNTQAINVAAQERNGVATAYAPSIQPTAVCMGASSGGIQGMSVGVSFGSSWTDANCMLLEQVRSVAVVLHDTLTAQEMMCGSDAYREARARTGRPCGQKGHRANSEPVEYTDPIIRARLGLPPL